MAKSEFTEMQYVLGFVSEFMKYLNKSTGQTPYFMLPSPHVEKHIGVDIIIEHFDHMEFHQYKRSDFLTTLAASEFKKGLPKSFKPFYRFSLYEEIFSQQFTRLRLLADMFPQHRVYYVAPKFSRHSEFQDHFWKEEIVDNSVFINCLQFNSARAKKYLKDNSGHHSIVFNKSSDSVYLFSDGIELDDKQNYPGYEKLKLEGGKQSFVETTQKLFYSLLDDEPEWFLIENKKLNEDFKTQFNWVRTKLLIKYNINMIPVINIK